MNLRKVLFTCFTIFYFCQPLFASQSSGSNPQIAFLNIKNVIEKTIPHFSSSSNFNLKFAVMDMNNIQALDFIFNQTSYSNYYAANPCPGGRLFCEFGCDVGACTVLRIFSRRPCRNCHAQCRRKCK